MDSLRAALVILCLLFAAGAVHAATPYVVSGVTADVTAENATAARDAAISEAMRKAFVNLASQIAPGVDVPNVSDTVIANMLRDFSLEKEQLSATRYAATFTFRFRQNAVRGAFGDKPILSPNELYAQQHGGELPPAIAPPVTQVSGAAAVDAVSGAPPAPVPTQQMLIQVPPESMQQMSVAPEMIRTAAGVTKIEFRSMTPTRAVMAMTYGGDTATMVQTLAARGVKLQPAAASNPPVYTLLP